MHPAEDDAPILRECALAERIACWTASWTLTSEPRHRQLAAALLGTAEDLLGALERAERHPAEAEACHREARDLAMALRALLRVAIARQAIGERACAPALALLACFAGAPSAEG